MNVRKLGIPIYANDKGEEYVLQEDLKLALDSDTFDILERLARKSMKLIWDGPHIAGYDVKWLSNVSLKGAIM